MTPTPATAERDHCGLGHRAYFSRHQPAMPGDVTPPSDMQAAPSLVTCSVTQSARPVAGTINGRTRRQRRSSVKKAFSSGHGVVGLLIAWMFGNGFGLMLICCFSFTKART